MKRIFFIILTLSFVFASIATVKATQSKTASTSSTSGYAQIISNDCYLFLYPNFDDNSKLFLLEESYFVKVTAVENNLFYKIQYLDFDGYVPKNKLQFVEEYPENPYLVGITFDIYDIANVCLRTSPKTIDDDSNIICTIEKGTKNLLYYGKTSGEEAILGLGNIWYYCSFEDTQKNIIYNGYIYSPLTRNLSSITGSKESLTYVNISNYVSVDSLLYLNLSTKNLLIIITAIPTLVAILLFILPFKNKKFQ